MTTQHPVRHSLILPLCSELWQPGALNPQVQGQMHIFEPKTQRGFWVLSLSVEPGYPPVQGPFLHCGVLPWTQEFLPTGQWRSKMAVLGESNNFEPPEGRAQAFWHLLPSCPALHSIWISKPLSGHKGSCFVLPGPVCI